MPDVTVSVRRTRGAMGDDKPTSRELTDEYGISAERVRQIEAKALTVMKDKLTA